MNKRLRKLRKYTDVKLALTITKRHAIKDKRIEFIDDYKLNYDNNTATICLAPWIHEIAAQLRMVYGEDYPFVLSDVIYEITTTRFKGIISHKQSTTLKVVIETVFNQEQRLATH